MTANDVVNTYMKLRESSSVAEAASATIERLSIIPSTLVDAFNAALLDLARSREQAEVIRNYRNELLSYFNS